MRTEAELDYSEEMIPELAESATKKAHLDALSRGQSITEIRKGKLGSFAPDGRCQNHEKDKIESIKVLGG